MPAQAAIAVIANDALGNFVVSTPLLQMLRAEYPQAKLHYFSGTRAQELWRSSPLIDKGYVLYGADPRQAAAMIPDHFDLVINLELSCWAKCFAALCCTSSTHIVGPCLSSSGRDDLPFQEDERGRLWKDTEWISQDLTSRYPFLESGFIGELFCRLAYLDGPVPGYAVPQEEPPFDTPQILIATAASLPEKLWPVEKWLALLAALPSKPGLIGAKPQEQKKFWQGGSGEEELVASVSIEDLRGKLTLPQVVGALARARQVITLDNGILHLAVSTGTPVVGLYRHGIHRLWAPPYENLTVVTPGKGSPVSDIEPQQVLNVL